MILHFAVDAAQFFLAGAAVQSQINDRSKSCGGELTVGLAGIPGYPYITEQRRPL